MLTIFGPKSPYCDGVSRRSFLKIGGLSMAALGGVGLADVLKDRWQLCLNARAFFAR